MPSVFTHLLIAEDALESLPLGPTRELLESHRKAYFAGCLGPDLPYFDIFHRYRGLPLGAFLSPVTHTVEKQVLGWLGWSQPSRQGWAQRLHGLGALDQIRAWQAWAGGRHPALSAFLHGMAMHVCADEVLHPKVVADGGDCATLEGSRRHRDIEIALDLVLLRQRGVALESLRLCGLVETFLGTVDRRGEYLSPALKTAWFGASAAAGDAEPLRRGEIDAWSLGFAGAMRLLENRLSPLQQHLDAFRKGKEELWRTHLVRERYLSAHVPRAVSMAGQWLGQGLSDPGLSRAV
jgi:hypothetical protein